jgi:hypothetical protein
MKIVYITTILLSSLAACQSSTSTEAPAVPHHQLNGSWKLVSNQVISKGDTVNATPEKGQEMIKIFNDTHFAFFNHNATPADTPVNFTAGGGTYTLSGDEYTEHLTYCSARDWENRDFHFRLTFQHDTLVQRGTEKIDSLNIDQEIIEKYVKQ